MTNYFICWHVYPRSNGDFLWKWQCHGWFWILWNLWFTEGDSPDAVSASWVGKLCVVLKLCCFSFVGWWVVYKHNMQQWIGHIVITNCLTEAGWQAHTMKSRVSNLGGMGRGGAQMMGVWGTISEQLKLKVVDRLEFSPVLLLEQAGRPLQAAFWREDGAG